MEQEYKGKSSIWQTTIWGIPYWLVYSPHTHDIPDHGLIPLKDFAAKYTEAFSNEIDFSLAEIDKTFTPTELSAVINKYKNG